METLVIIALAIFAALWLIGRAMERRGFTPEANREILLQAQYDTLRERGMSQDDALAEIQRIRANLPKLPS